MSQETLSQSPQERLPVHEHRENKEISQKHKDKLEKASNKAERQRGEDLEKARSTVEYEAVTSKEIRQSKQESRADKIPRFTSKDIKDVAYKKTLKRIQGALPAGKRQFSKFIHQPAVEKSSEMLTRTIARPTGILGGGIIACIGMAIIVYTSKHTGFRLSGTEFVLLFVSGWTLGLVIEFIYNGVSKLRGK